MGAHFCGTRFGGAFLRTCCFAQPKCNRKIYLFRDEYIFDLEKAVVVETPELGHATYVFSKPSSMESFLALYTRISKDDIRNNRENWAEKLGFLGRAIHGSNPRGWLQET